MTQPSFSAHMRADLIARQRTQPFDLVVVGGGITGTMTAWDAAVRGLRVALVEKDDFGWGTSGRSSRLAHGGLRYLEQFAFGLVFEGTHERRTLMDLAPHLVRPLPFVVPTYQGDRNGRAKINLGLWLYDLLAGRRGIGWHKSFGRDAFLAIEPHIRPDRLTGGLRYFDCATDDGRLTLMAARSAFEAGALPVSRVAFVGPVMEDGMVRGAEVEDRLGGERYVIATSAIVNAAGPWTDAVLGTYPGGHPPMLRPSKGVHLVVPHARLPVRHAVVMNAPVDGRVTFCIPWREATYIGTTDTEFLDPTDEVKTTAADVDYLLTIVAHYFPAQALTRDDVISTWAGVRPLVGQDKDSTYDVSREHTIFEHPGGAFTIAGGKLTTCRKMAEEVTDRVVDWLRAHGDTRRFLSCQTAKARVTGTGDLTPETLDSHRLGLEDQFGLSTFAADHFQKAYGARAEEVLAGAEERGDAAPIVDGLPYIWGEIAEAVEREMVISLPDFMVRRTHIFYKALDQGAAAEEAVAARLGQSLGWERARIDEEVAWYRRLREESVGFRRA